MKRKSGISTIPFLSAFAFWTALGLFFFSQDLTEALHSKQPALLLPLLECWLSRAYIWGLLAPLAILLARRVRFDRKHVLRWLAFHLSIGAGMAVTASILCSWAGFMLEIPWYRPDLPTALKAGLAYGFHASFLTYWIILGAYEAFDNYQRVQLEKKRALQAEIYSSELKSQLTEAQLSALKAQLRPHFLFNALNAIVVLVRRKRNSEAEEMIGKLGKLLHDALEGRRTQEVPLRAELKFVESYLDIERVRFKDRLSVEINSSHEVLDAMVPYMCLQPIAENAVHHGIARRAGSGRVSIVARRAGGWVEVEIADNGPGLPPEGDRREQGLGISNTRERLNYLYGEKGALHIHSSCGNGTVVTLRVPYHVLEVKAQ